MEERTASSLSILKQEKVEENIDIAKRLLAALEEYRDSDLPFTKTTENQGLDYRKARNVVNSLRNCAGLQKVKNEQIQYELTPYEELYAEMIGVSKDDYEYLAAPSFFKDRVNEVAKECLTDRNYQIFLRRMGGDVLEDISVDFNITRERVREICLKTHRVLMAPARVQRILYGDNFQEDVDAAVKKAREGAITECVDKARQEIEDRAKTMNADKIMSHFGTVLGSPASGIMTSLKYAFEENSSETPWMAVRTYNALTRADCRTISDVLGLMKWDLLPGVRNLGKQSRDNITEVCLYYAPEETRAALSLAASGKAHREELRKACLAYQRWGKNQIELSEPIEKVIPQEYLNTSCLGHIGLTTFQDLCTIIINRGYYSVTWSSCSVNLYTDRVRAGLSSALDICEILFAQ